MLSQAVLVGQPIAWGLRMQVPAHMELGSNPQITTCRLWTLGQLWNPATPQFPHLEMPGMPLGMVLGKETGLI